MRKSDKKREKQLIDCLNTVCEQALDIPLPGFAWLTHLVDYQRFPASLRVYCIVEPGHPDSEQWLTHSVRSALMAAGIPINAAQVHCLSEARFKQRLTN